MLLLKLDLPKHKTKFNFQNKQGWIQDLSDGGVTQINLGTKNPDLGTKKNALQAKHFFLTSKTQKELKLMTKD